jgi:hypothetical protein
VWAKCKDFNVKACDTYSNHCALKRRVNVRVETTVMKPQPIKWQKGKKMSKIDEDLNIKRKRKKEEAQEN